MAVVGVWGATSRDANIEDLTSRLVTDQVRIVQQRRNLAFADIAAALTTPTCVGLPDGWEFTILLHDADAGCLTPIFPTPNHTDQTLTFETGQGPAGIAWDTDDLVVMKGSAISNDEHNLTPVQQTALKPYRRAVACLLRDDVWQPIGVLQALNKGADDAFDEPGNRALIKAVASTIAVALLTVPDPGASDAR